MATCRWFGAELATNGQPRGRNVAGSGPNWRQTASPRARCRRFTPELATNGRHGGEMSPDRGPTGDKRQALGRDVAGSGPNWRQTASPRARCRRFTPELATNGRHGGEMSPDRFPTGDKRQAGGACNHACLTNKNGAPYQGAPYSYANRYPTQPEARTPQSCW